MTPPWSATPWRPSTGRWSRVRRHHPSPSVVCVAHSRSVMWFRRDLRLADHPALNAAADAATRWCRSSSSTRTCGVRPEPPDVSTWSRSLRSLDADMGRLARLARG